MWASGPFISQQGKKGLDFIIIIVAKGREGAEETLILLKEGWGCQWTTHRVE